MTLHPQVADMFAQVPEIDVTAPDFDVSGLRTALRVAGQAETGPVMAAGVQDVVAAGVPVRIYRPRAQAPLLIYLHGGGFCVGDVETYDAYARHLAALSGWSVASIDYRLAPEHPFPAGLSDARVATGWLLAHAEAIGVDPESVAIMGDSAGANLTLGVSRAFAGRLRLQILIYPCLDPNGGFASYTQEDAGITARTMDWYWDQYLPEGIDRTDPDVAPLGAGDLGRLPRTLIITGEHDPLRDEGENLAAVLAQAGVPVVGTRYLGLPHGFIRRYQIIDGARDALAQAVSALTDVAAI